MKTGKTLTQLAAEIERQAVTKLDYIAPTKQLTVITDSDTPKLRMETDRGIVDLGINSLAHRQIGEHVGIPAPYYDVMKSKAPELLATNINHWLHTSQENRMVRTLDGNARSFMSQKFRCLDNYDLGEAVIPTLLEKELAIVSCELTETRLYIKAVDRRVVRQVNGLHIIDGKQVDFDHVSPSLTISNSEVGCGALSIEAGFFKHGCKNMAIFRERSMRKYHVGGKHELSAEVVAMLTDQTRKVSDAATWMQVKDVVMNAFNPQAFDGAVAEVQALTGQRITGDVAKVVEITGRQLGATEGERKSILRHLIEGADLTRFGLLNAITRTAEDLEDYDRATDFERMGGKVIELPANDWQKIAEAA